MKNKIATSLLKTKTSLLINFKPYLKSFSILKNKDQKGEHDKSYSGTDSKHQAGSNRVLDDDNNPTITTVITDSQLHHHTNRSGSDFSKEDKEKINTTSDNYSKKDPSLCSKTKSNGQIQPEIFTENVPKEEKKKKETPSDKQEKY
jgi:hypothetical protein